MGNRFTKAAIPTSATANLSGRSIGANPRKHKLTEGDGTNPSRMGMGGGGGLMSGTSHNRLNPRYAPSGYAQDTAPHKSLTGDSFGVGGPGFPRPMK